MRDGLHYNGGRQSFRLRRSRRMRDSSGIGRLIGGNEPRVGFPAGKKHAFSGCHLEDFTVGIDLHLTRKNVKKLVFSRVDMGLWFGAPSHLSDNEVKRSAIIRGPRHLASKNTLVPGRIA